MHGWTLAPYWPLLTHTYPSTHFLPPKKKKRKKKKELGIWHWKCCRSTGWLVPKTTPVETESAADALVDTKCTGWDWNQKLKLKALQMHWLTPNAPGDTESAADPNTFALCGCRIHKDSFGIFLRSDSCTFCQIGNDTIVPDPLGSL